MAERSSRASDSRTRLGRGLAALLGDVESDNPSAGASQGVRQMPIEFLKSNARNPRQNFDEANLSELADSIKERGIVQPILVRPSVQARDTFEIVAGERRWRAAQQAGLHSVPVIVLSVGDREALEIAIVENVQRADLNALEEAAGYFRLAEEFGYNHADLARVVGKSRSHVANTLRLLQLPVHSRELLSSGSITAGHARALLTLPDPDTVADRIVATGLTVRDVEKVNKSGANAKSISKIQTTPDDVNTRSLEEKVATALGINVKIKRAGKQYDMRIKASDIDQLTFICDRLMSEN